jgi:drug/metabolite transporter (DMT)-like permease
MAWLIIFNRKSAGDAPVLVMQFALALMAAPLLLVAAATFAAIGRPHFALPFPSIEVIGKCALVACTASVGHLMIYWATTHAGAAIVSPMTYIQLLVAAALGWMWFGDAPDLVSLSGAALIIGSGLLLWGSQRPPLPPRALTD